MANPQVEHGHIRLANQLDEAMTVAEFNVIQAKIVRCLARLTYGWKRRTVRISQAELAEKLRRSARDGSWKRAFDLLTDNGVVVEVEPAVGRRPAAYALNKNFERWGDYSVPRAFLDRQFKDRPDHVDDVPRAIARLLAKSTESPQEDMDFGAPSAETDDAEDDRRVAPTGQSTDENEVRSVAPPGPSNSRSVAPGGPPWGPTGTTMGPPQATVVDPKPSSPNGLAGGKAIESNRKPAAGKKGAAAAAAGSHEPTAEKPGSTQFESAIVNAAVGACRRRWPDHALSVAYATDLALEFMAIGIPQDFAADTIRTAAARKLGKPPASIAWFRSRVTDAWRDRSHEVEKHGTDNGQQKPRAKSAKAAELKDVVDSVLDPRLEERRRDYDTARKAAGIEWAKDPANAAAYREIVESCNARYDLHTLAKSWGAKARDMDVVSRCAEACPFPQFDLWLRTGRRRTRKPLPRGLIS